MLTDLHQQQTLKILKENLCTVLEDIVALVLADFECLTPKETMTEPSLTTPLLICSCLWKGEKFILKFPCMTGLKGAIAANRRLVGGITFQFLLVALHIGYDPLKKNLQSPCL